MIKNKQELVMETSRNICYYICKALYFWQFLTASAVSYNL